MPVEPSSKQQPNPPSAEQEKPLAVPYADALSNWLLVSETHMRCQQLLQRDLRVLNLSIAQHDVLVGIWRHSGLTQRELADALYVVKSNVTGLLKNLEHRGLVRRKQDPKDARSNRLSLTPTGADLVKRSLQVQRRIVTAMLAPIDRAEMRQLEEVMGRVSAALEVHAHQR